MSLLKRLVSKVRRVAGRAPPPPVRVVMIGNCQASAMAYLMPLLSRRIEVLAAVQVDAPDNDHDRFAAALDQADIIVSQVVRDDYPLAWVGRSHLTALYGNKLIFFTNHFFDGYYPELCYIHDPEGRRHVLPGPMDSYHYKTVIHAFQQGLSVEDAIALCDDDAFYAEHFGGIAELSLAELRRREEAVDIRIHDYIADTFRRERLFFTFNHPTSHLLLRTCDGILRHAGIVPEIGYATLSPEEYLKRVAKPVAGPVYRGEGMSFGNDVPHTGFELIADGGDHRLGAMRDYALAELVEAFYRLYDAHSERVLGHQINFRAVMS